MVSRMVGRSRRGSEDRVRSVARKFANSLVSMLAISFAFLCFRFRALGFRDWRRQTLGAFQNRRSDLMNRAARSPMTTHGAMVLPVVIRGMIDASATRRLPMP